MEKIFKLNIDSIKKAKILQVKNFVNFAKSVFCLTVHEDSLATGSMDKTIKIWSLKDGKLLQTLYGHVKGVWCLRFITRFLLCSGSYDSTIKIWNVKDGTCSRTLLSHTGPVWCLCRSENIIVSASQDKTVCYLKSFLEGDLKII